MTRRFSPPRGRRALLVAGVLIFVLAGDRGFTAISLGIDPLEVLDLQVKPNVFVVLDTSGSMEDLTDDSASNYGGDHIRSKMWQAKQVLKAVFQANQDKASFMFGVYRFSSAARIPAATWAVGNVSGTGAPDRFVYSAQSWARGDVPEPGLHGRSDDLPVAEPEPRSRCRSRAARPRWPTTELVVNSLYAFQWIQNGGGIVNNTLVFTENGGPICTVNVAPDFYISAGGGRDGDPERDELLRGQGEHLQRLVRHHRDAGHTHEPDYAPARSATATTATPHGFATGHSVTIAGASPAGYNGAKTITVTSATQFTYTLGGALATPATGTITATLTAGTANRFSFRGSGMRDFTINWTNAASTTRRRHEADRGHRRDRHRPW